MESTSSTKQKHASMCDEDNCAYNENYSSSSTTMQSSLLQHTRVRHPLLDLTNCAVNLSHIFDSSQIGNQQVSGSIITSDLLEYNSKDGLNGFDNIDCGNTDFGSCYEDNAHTQIGSLLPIEGKQPKFAQLYIYDTENEIKKRMSAIRSSEEVKDFDQDVVRNLKEMFDQYNPIVKAFKMASEKFKDQNFKDLKLRLIRNRDKDGRIYNLPTTTEVTALIVEDIDMTFGDRDIIVETQSGLLQCISELHPSYIPMHYRILFPYAEDGYQEYILHQNQQRKRSKVTMREFFAYRLQDRENDHSILLLSRILLQQFIVDAYTMIESQHLYYIRMNQKQLRSELYSCLTDVILRGDTNASHIGKRIVLPSNFTGGTRYTTQNFLDAMTICMWAGCADLFITFTYNPKWPEVIRAVQRNHLRLEDRPDIISRIFKSS
ncbi:uncharacterized protein G2W53_003846 [Senna tora]|uniref:Helitron helicase-like domain-containing protein n=1 Tax=Senna tora TaxID=362788 RepID=A0A834XBX6_9FABA|nr:uncharacterized protein G2W53_003846 [Senna tora]